MKKRLFSLAQLILGLGLIVFLFASMENRGDIADAIRDAAHNWPALLAAILLFLVCMLLCTIRWHLLLGAQGLRLPFSRTVVIYFIGHFFNSFMFGSTGGDVIKAYYAARETRHKKAEAVSTILLDRIIGLFALIALVVAIMLFRLPFFLAHTETRTALVFFFLLFLAAVAGTTVVFRRDLFERWSPLRRLRDETAVGSVVARMYKAFQIVMTHPSTLWKTAALSLANHVLQVVAAGMLGKALDISIRWVDYLTIVPIVNAVAAIPVTPGGLGTREAAAKLLFGVVGVPETRAVLLSLLMYGMVLSWSLVGGLVYLLDAVRGGKRVTYAGEEGDGVGGDRTVS